MKINRLLTAAAISFFSINSMAAQLTVINENAAKQGEAFYVAAYGTASSSHVVGFTGGNWGNKHLTTDLDGDDLNGKYRIAEIKFTICAADQCFPNTGTDYSKWPNCNLVDHTTGSVNEVNAQVLVRLHKNGTCDATVN